MARHGRSGGSMHQGLRRLGRQHRPSGMRCADRRGQVVRRDILELIADGARLQRPLHQLLVPKARQREDPHRGEALPDGAGRRHPVHDRHLEVHQHHVGLELGTALQRLLPLRRLAG
jgi:hypothetical protein